MITKEEIIAIYKKHGRDAVNPNIASALAEAMSLVGDRILDALANLAKKQYADHHSVVAAIQEVARVVASGSQPVSQARASGRCYCGTLITEPTCGTCGRVH